MRLDRHATILDVIKTQDIETQEELVCALRTRGFSVTQATVSRDIKEMRLVKVMNDEGVYKYDVVESTEKGLTDRQLRVFAESVISLESANNLLVIKTITGSANAACNAIDSLKWPEILGTIAGDDTILIILKSNEAVEGVMKRFREMMK